MYVRAAQTKHIASLHVTIAADTELPDFVLLAKTIRECMHAWGLHGGVTVQPEFAPTAADITLRGDEAERQGTSTAVAGTNDADQQLTHVNMQRTCSMPCVQDCLAKSCCD